MSWRANASPPLYWKERALSGYLQSAQRGEVHYYHHLADYYSDVAEDGAAAVKWARKDLRLRENFATQAALAWALYRDGQFGEAVCWIDRALASGVVDARLYFWAGDDIRRGRQGSGGPRASATSDRTSIRPSPSFISTTERHEARITSAAFSATM